MRINLIKTMLVMFFFLVVTLSSAYAGNFAQKDSTNQKSKKHAKVEKCADMSKCKDMAKCKDMSKCKDSANCKVMDKCIDKKTGKSMNKSMKMDKSMNMSKTMEMDSKKAVKVINLKAIDKNKDGKVYQCPMDFDVLSDKPGKDPKCGMELKEVTLEQAGKSLTDHGFKVK